MTFTKKGRRRATSWHWRDVINSRGSPARKSWSRVFHGQGDQFRGQRARWILIAHRISLCKRIYGHNKTTISLSRAALMNGRLWKCRCTETAKESRVTSKKGAQKPAKYFPIDITFLRHFRQDSCQSLNNFLEIAPVEILRSQAVECAGLYTQHVPLRQYLVGH